MRPGVTIALTAVDRRRLGAIVGNRNVPQKHAWRARDRAVDGGRSWHRRDHAPDGQVEDLRLALAGTLRRRRGRPSRNIAFPISDLGSRYRAPGPVKHDDADLRERALGDAGTYFFRENEGRLAAIAAYFAHLPGGPDDGANDFLGLGLQHGFVVYAEPPSG